MKESFLKSISPVEVTSAQGLYLGRRTTYDVDHLRIEAVVARVIRGLFLHEYGQRLPTDAEVSGISMQEWSKMSPNVKRGLSKVIDPLRNLPDKPIGDGSTFRYRLTHVPGMVRFSAWLLTFYGGLFFLGITSHEASLKTAQD
ncbi:MAG: hypothetical protein ABIF09_17265 [Gemmatimonadota bacterium]